VETDKSQEDYEKYQKFLEEYEKDLKELKTMGKNMSKDFITEEMAERNIKSHLKEEQILERKLGNKFLTKIDP